jgi:ABC-type transport system involved in multi-copper enzyme maturation permease subunit
VSSLRAEWIKLRSVRTTWVLLGLGLLAEALLAGLLPGLASRSDLGSDSDIEDLLRGTGLLFTFVLVLGVLAITNEYRHRTVNWTFTTEPSRSRVVVAKLAMAATLGLAAGLLFVAVNAGLALTILRSRGIALPGSEDIVASYAGSVVAMVLIAAFGVGVGAVVRHQVGAVVGSIAVFFVLSPLAALLGDAGRYFPAQAFAALQRGSGEDLLEPVPGGVVLAAYVAVLAVVGTLLVRRADVTE